jgi:putative ubiquitin-RnfH superfamily antitoxin RatB of RatAB toxin-antitoxin module
MASLIDVELVYALPERQTLLKLSVPAGTTARQLVLGGALAEQHPELDLAQAPLGIFGKVLNHPEQRVLEAGERVEVYRPLLADPKDVRRQRAARLKAEQAGR